MSFVRPLKAMLLAAGRGERLRPLTDRVPKCMVTVWGKPVLEHNIERLVQFGVKELIINLCHLPEVVMDHFGDGRKWGVKITYSIEEDALGTAGGVKYVESYFDRTFLVWYGDNLSTCNLDRLYNVHRMKAAKATIVLSYREDPTASGIVGLDNGARITQFLEKPKWEEVFSHWINAGIYVLEPEILDKIPSGMPYDFGKEVFPELLKDNQLLYGYTMGADEGLWWVDTPEDLKHVNKSPCPF